MYRYHTPVALRSVSDGLAPSSFKFTTELLALHALCRSCWIYDRRIIVRTINGQGTKKWSSALSVFAMKRILIGGGVGVGGFVPLSPISIFMILPLNAVDNVWLKIYSRDRHRRCDNVDTGCDIAVNLSTVQSLSAFLTRMSWKPFCVQFFPKFCDDLTSALIVSDPAFGYQPPLIICGRKA